MADAFGLFVIEFEVFTVQYAAGKGKMNGLLCEIVDCVYFVLIWLFTFTSCILRTVKWANLLELSSREIVKDFEYTRNVKFIMFLITS